MGRIMAIDYGRKRTGIAVTDSLRIAANGLPTIETNQIHAFLKDYFSKESVDIVVIGFSAHIDGTPTAIEADIQLLISFFKNHFPAITIERMDESYSSIRAREIILQSGAGQKKRRDKSLVDKISAVLILQEFMERL
jgi:putative Holliday junction resolvase